MRLKLVIITSFLAAMVGAGASIAIILVAFSSLRAVKPGPLVLATRLWPIVTILMSAFFVYRHTARRRKLQAFLTALVATFLSLCLFLLASVFTARRDVIRPPQPAGPSAMN